MGGGGLILRVGGGGGILGGWRGGGGVLVRFVLYCKDIRNKKRFTNAPRGLTTLFGINLICGGGGGGGEWLTGSDVIQQWA